MHRAHIRNVAVAVVLASATATGLTGTALAAPADRPSRTASSAETSAAAVVDAARAAAFAHASATGVGKGDALQVQDAMLDPEGARHVRFQRSHDGMPVLGGDLVVHLDRHLVYTGVTRAAHHTVEPATTTARLTPAQAAATAASAAGGQAGTARLVVDARGGASALAYQVHVTGRADETGTGSRTVVVDAVTGEVRSTTPDSDEFLSPKLLATLRASGQALRPDTASLTVGARRPVPYTSSVATYPRTATGSGTSLFVGIVPLTTTQTGASSYLLKDPTRFGTETRDAKNRLTENFSTGTPISNSANTWGNGTVSDRTTAAVDAQYGITATLDFYQKTFGRKGIANDSRGAQGMVHFGNRIANAFWDPACTCMLYGDGDGVTFPEPLVALDVTGHELTHGVVDATAGLQPTRVDAAGNQYGEPGALNESLADIFGSAVEFFADNPANPPNYLIGEKLGLSQTFLRRLDHPSLDKLEGTIDYWSPAVHDAEVHAGSGVSSHAFYLLAEGSGRKTVDGVTYDSPTYRNLTVEGIGRDKATAVFYRALTRYMVSSTDFHDARLATLAAARDLYGQDSTEYQAVDRAWAAVNVTAANTPQNRS